MSEQRLREVYRQVLARRAPADRAGCVEPDRLTGLLEQTDSEDERLRTLDHVMGCVQCRGEFELLRALARADQRTQWRWRPWLAVAATAVLVVGAGLLLRSGGGPGRDVLRGANDDIILVGPTGPLASGARLPFVWRAAPGVSSYRLELLDARESVIWRAVTSDTTLTLPDSVALTPGDYRWWVQEAAAPPGAARSSGMVAFSVPAP